MALDEQLTGSPPAVTHEQLITWRKLADDVSAAMAMGGEQGLELLKGLMAEWCEAVEDVNLARKICVNLAAEGRRDEALEWHAEGFFEVSDLLSPDRTGWDEWVVALTSRGIAVPAMRQQLKELADRIHEELALRDLSGSALAQYLDGLRRNVLSKDHLGERLTLIETIRGFDPSGTIWRDMVAPIRQQRAKEIEGEFLAAIATGNFFATDALIREVSATSWEHGVPGPVQMLVEGVEHWRKSRELARGFAATTSKLEQKGEALAVVMQAGGANKLDFNRAFDAARSERDRFLQLRQEFRTALSVARRVPSIAEKLAQEGFKEELKSAENRAGPWIEKIGQATEYWEWVNRFRRLQGEIDEFVRKAPLEGGSWEEAKARCDRWLAHAAEVFGRCKELTQTAPITPPDSFRQEHANLEAQVARVRNRKARVIRQERLVVSLVIGGLVTVVAAFLALLGFARS